MGIRIVLLVSCLLAAVSCASGPPDSERPRASEEPPPAGHPQPAPAAPPQPEPSPPRAQSASVPRPRTEQAAQQILSALRPGRIVYNPPQKMKVAVPVRVQVRIGELAGADASSLDALERDLVSGLERPALASEPVRVSKTMKVLLTGVPEEFRITLQSPEEQLVQSGLPTEWRWLVTPLKRGTRRLHLSAVAIVNVGGVEKMREFSVYDTDVAVQINYAHLLTDNWGRIVSVASATGLSGGLAALWKRKRRGGRKVRTAAGGAD